MFPSLSVRVHSASKIVSSVKPTYAPRPFFHRLHSEAPPRSAQFTLKHLRLGAISPRERLYPLKLVAAAPICDKLHRISCRPLWDVRKVGCGERHYGLKLRVRNPAASMTHATTDQRQVRKFLFRRMSQGGVFATYSVKGPAREREAMYVLYQ